MADGDAWSLDRIACKYIADNGTTFRFRVLEAYQSQAGLGWTACDAVTQVSAPKGLKPRKVLCWDAGDHSKRRSIVVGTNAAYVAIVPGTTTFTVQNPATDVEDTFTVYMKEGERFRGQELD